MLIVTDGGLIPVGVVSNIWDLENLKGRFGIDYKCVSSKEVFDEMDKIVQSESEQERAQEITDRLTKNARSIGISILSKREV